MKGTIDLRRMAIFATVVQEGSMRRAARQLRMTPSAVSQHVRHLEKETGVTLLRRSTRKLALTDAGQAFYDGCSAMLEAARTAHARLSELHDEVTGELAVSAPVGFAAAHLANAVQPLVATYPQLSLRLVVTDDQLDLTKEHIDIAIAIGTSPPASSLLRAHLATWENVLVASPAYLDAHGTPQQPEDLAGHVFVALPPWHHGGDVLSGPSGARYPLAPRPRIVSNNQLTIKQLTLAGCGISFNVIPEIREELAVERLVRVLPKWSAPQLSVDALMLPRAKQPAKVREGVRALARYLRRLG
jgi:DNA-binding transcriptional LysR family regulator